MISKQVMEIGTSNCKMILNFHLLKKLAITLVPADLSDLTVDVMVKVLTMFQTSHLFAGVSSTGQCSHAKASHAHKLTFMQHLDCLHSPPPHSPSCLLWRMDPPPHSMKGSGMGDYTVPCSALPSMESTLYPCC